LKLKLGPQFP
jgi:hypothetical protein